MKHARESFCNMASKIQYDPITQKVVDPISGNNSVLVGYKGSKFIETGTVYAPYIPLITTASQASVNSYGFVITVENDNTIRYTYDPDRDGDLAAMDDIEEKGLIILDENEEEHWIDAIDPDIMKKNLEWVNPKFVQLKAMWGEEAQECLEKLYGLKNDSKFKYETNTTNR